MRVVVHSSSSSRSARQVSANGDPCVSCTDTVSRRHLVSAARTSGPRLMPLSLSATDTTGLTRARRVPRQPSSHWKRLQTKASTQPDCPVSSGSMRSQALACVCAAVTSSSDASAPASVARDSRPQYLRKTVLPLDPVSHACIPVLQVNMMSGSVSVLVAFSLCSSILMTTAAPVTLQDGSVLPSV